MSLTINPTSLKPLSTQVTSPLALCDTLMHIFSFLPRKKLASVSCVSKFWRQTAQIDYLWQLIAARDYNLSPPISPRYRSWHECVKTKVTLAQQVSKKSHTEAVLPDLVDHFSLLALSEDTLCFCENRRRVKSWPVQGGPTSTLIKFYNKPKHMEIVEDTLYIITNRQLRIVNLSTKEQTKITLSSLNSNDSISHFKISGNRLFIQTGKNILDVWNTKTGKKEQRKCRQ